jgi:hypothetical protein
VALAETSQRQKYGTAPTSAPCMKWRDSSFLHSFLLPAAGRSQCRKEVQAASPKPTTMSKRTFYTNITPLPAQVTRQIAVDELHNHGVMIQLNPLVMKFERTTPHKEAPPDEYHCIWYEITDKVSYLPGVKGQVKYKACFFDRPIGLQTHCYAPAGLDIKAKWSVGGNMPGEPREARELGVDTPRDGLYLREEVDMRCNIMLTSFVKKNLRNAHKVLVDRLLKKVEFVEEAVYQQSVASSSPRSSILSPAIGPGGVPMMYQQRHSEGSLDDMYKYPPRPVSMASSAYSQQSYPQYAPASVSSGEDPAKFAPQQQQLQQQQQQQQPPPGYWPGPYQAGDIKMHPPPPVQRNSYLNPHSGRHFAAELPGSEVVFPPSQLSPRMPAELYSPTPPSSQYSNASNSPRTGAFEKEAS